MFGTVKQARGGSPREKGRDRDRDMDGRQLESLSSCALRGNRRWGRGGNIHFYFSQKPSSRRMTFIGWILNITWLPDGSVLSEALSGLVLTCPDKSAVYPAQFLYPKYHFLPFYLIFPQFRFLLWSPSFTCFSCTISASGPLAMVQSTLCGYSV